MLYRLREALARFMYGRYGNDELNKFLLVAFFVVVIVNMFTRNWAVWIVEIAILAVSWLRMLSRNHERRRAENAVYLRAKARVLGLFGRGRGAGGAGYGNSGGYNAYGNSGGYGGYGNSGGGTRSGPTMRERMQYKYMSCPSCGQRVRVPRGKGTVEVRCPKCGTIFRERT